MESGLRHRRAVHLRRVSCTAYERGDGMLDVEGVLVDTKPYATRSHERAVIEADEPIHEMTLRLTVDERLFIRDAAASMANSPYGTCRAISDAYRKLIGMRIGPGFSFKVKTAFRGAAGCSHLTELVGPIATTAFQAMASLEAERRGVAYRIDTNTGMTPLGGCHALRTDGEVVRRYYPQHYREPE